jgi:hypothetical protein
VDGADISQDIKAECAGDVNGSYNPIPGKMIYTSVNNSCSMTISTGRQFEIPVYLNDNVELGALGLKFKVQSSKFKVIDVISNIDGLIYNVDCGLSSVDCNVNIAWAATSNAINVNPAQPLFYIKAIYNGEANSSSFQIPASIFQLSPESEIADIDANLISTDKLFMPEIVISNQLPVISFKCYPNPFNNITNIEYTLPEDLNVRLNIYNVIGEKVASLVTNERQQAGQYTIKFDGSNLKQGIYYCKIEATNNTSAYNKTDIMIIAR